MTTATELSVTWPQALAWRLERQLLEPVGSLPVPEVVQRLGAVLAMDRSLAELAVRARRTTSRPGELVAALEAGTVVLAFAYRGATHYLSAEDGGDILALRCAGRQWELRSWVDHYGLSAEDWPDFRAAVRDSLADGPLTVDELGAALTRRRAYRHLRPIFDGDPWTLLKPLTWQGDMSFGLPRDGKPTFQRLDTNPHWRGIPDLDDAGPRAITAFVRGYGPTTVEQIHQWFGGGLSAGRKRIDGWIAGLGDALVPVDVDGDRALVVRDDVDALAAATPTDAVRLLPGHDQWVMGPGTKDTRVVPAAVRQAVTHKANLVLAGGVVSGTWTRRGGEIEVDWLADGPRPDADLDREIARIAGILGD